MEPSRTGYLVFWWSVLDLLRLDILVLDEKQRLALGDGIPKCTRFAVPEPGNKVRIVTMTHASLSTFL